MKRILYISLTGMAEPLGQSQVLEYLWELAKIHQILIFSFERQHDQAEISGLKQRICAQGIQWVYHAYSNCFGLVSTIWMLFIAIIHLLKVCYKFKPQVIHARSLLPALLAYPLAKIWRAKLIFDIRGFAIDEKVDCGRLKKNSMLYKFLHGLENFLYRHSDHLVTLTYASKAILCKDLALSEDKVIVIPTCANKDLFYSLPVRERQELRKALGYDAQLTILIHTGAVSGWYDFDKEVRLFAGLYQNNPHVHFIVLNKNEHAFIYDTFARYQIPATAYTVRFVPFNQVIQWLNMANAALFFIKPSYAKQASAPTKFAEIVAAGLFSITNKGVGDMDFYMRHYPVGIAFDLLEFDTRLPLYIQAVQQALNQPFDLAAAQMLFNEHFDKTLAINRYAELYA